MNLKYDRPRSNFAFNCYLRHYNAALDIRSGLSPEAALTVVLPPTRSSNEYSSTFSIEERLVECLDAIGRAAAAGRCRFSPG